ncbi:MULTISPECIES: vWA domain-containing protein [Algibacter]|jgi:Ca-activated chloride channel family protein|uniref:BatB protein n=1 Tax=Algibacter lectus TaxID=221126 RepID=A0A090WQE5_9FLAO|nr:MULTISPECIES: VWA domain-containing protein [Algibacter]MDO7137278.1 VWA domain-containing protein [Algibacter lectus]MWW24227.1 VWA domain-containing protein [Algibacter lectus]TDY62245.1 Ca-activated chloride channel family protein [Algibacter lectus]GAL60733.1 BatB protein [Algibacter lectus]GAL78423.1 BatB protein [Algibacter lectus]
MFQLEEKIWFWTLAIIPVIIVLFLLLQFWRYRTQKKFADKELLKRLSPNKSLFKSILKVVVLSLAFLCLTIALVNPKVGTKLETVKREGVDIVFAVDVSKSMLAEDIAPNRLEKSKQLVTQIINNLASDRVGIIAYAGKAFPQLPITTDYGSAKMFLNNMNTDMLSSQGTAINEAIKLATTYFDNEEQTNRVLIIISDGEDHSEDALAYAEQASEQGIKIFTIGVGDLKGGPIPIKRNGIVLNYKKDNQGETVITRLNEDTLKKIAEEANGAYINGKNTNDVVEHIREILNGMDKTEFEAKQFADFKDQFQWFLGLGIFLLLIDVFLLERKTGWLKKLNLFNENL